MVKDVPGFFFIGSAIVPGFMVLAGDPGIAVMTLAFLFCVGGLAGIADPQAPFRSRNGKSSR
jgi:hypothetical protein